MFNYLSFPSPNTQKNTPFIFTFLSRYCSISLFDISTAFFKRINYMNFIFMSLNLPFIANLLQSGFQSPPTPLKLWRCSAGISVLAHPVDTFQFSSYKSQLHWPNWPVVSAGNTLYFLHVRVPPASQATSHLSHFPFYFILSHWRAGTLDLWLSFLLIYTPVILPIVLVSDIIRMPSQVCYL